MSLNLLICNRILEKVQCALGWNHFCPQVYPWSSTFNHVNDSGGFVTIIMSSWVLIQHECSHQVAFLGRKPSPITLSLMGWNHFWPWGHPGSQILSLSAILEIVLQWKPFLGIEYDSGFKTAIQNVVIFSNYSFTPGWNHFLLRKLWPDNHSYCNCLCRI